MSELGRFRWFAGEDLVEPEEVWCPEVGYPHSDVKGRTQFENTHFDELSDAWTRLHNNAISRARRAGRVVADAHATLRAAERDAGKACEHLRGVFDALHRHEQQREADRG